jgi:multidrug resistance efflux pump
MRRLSAWARRWLALAFWSAAVLLLIGLAHTQAGRIQAPGIVEKREAAVSASIEGTLAAVKVELMDHVMAGQELAVLDDTAVRHELNTAVAELERLRAESDASAEQMRLEVANFTANDLGEERRFGANEERAKVDVLTRRAQQEFNRITLEGMELLLNRQKAMVDEDILDAQTYDDTRKQYEALKVEIEKTESTLSAAETHANEAARLREKKAQTSLVLDVDRIAAPLKQALAVQDTVIAAIRDRLNSFTLHAPVSGQITRILNHAGERVLAATPFIYIESDAERRVMAYVDERAASQLTSGAEVVVVSRKRPEQAARGRLERLGESVQQMPLPLQPNVNTPAWGMPVLVAGLPQNAFYPGELVDVKFAVGSPLSCISLPSGS